MSSPSAGTTKSKLSASDQNPTSNNHRDPGKDKDASDMTQDVPPTAEDQRAKINLASTVDKTKTVIEGVEVEDPEDADQTNSDTGGPEDDEGTDEAPPLPNEDIPPLPQELPPAEDDGWAPVWEETAQAFYFYNRFTGATQWTNPRVPETSPYIETAPGVAPAATASTVAHEDMAAATRPAGGYDPSIHGDYDPTAWYAQPATSDAAAPSSLPSNPSEAYAATGAFNRFTGRWQAADLTPENYNDENKSKRQMNAFFDVDAAANNHDGRSLKAERSGKKLSKTELKQFKEKRKAKKEEKRRAWLRD